MLLTFNKGVEMMRQLMKAKRTVLYSFEVDVFNSSTINLNRYLSELEHQIKSNEMTLRWGSRIL